MLLILTSVGDHTADYLCQRLARAAAPFVRLDSENVTVDCEFGRCASETTLWHSGVALPASCIRNIWYRRPKALHCNGAGDPGEQQHLSEEWAEALEGYLAHVPESYWMNHPARNANASHKLEQLTRAARFGLRVPETLVTQSPEALDRFWHACKGEVIIKPLSSGFIERASSGQHGNIYTSAVSEHHLELREQVRTCPTFFQQRIRKKVDARVTIVDNEVHCVALSTDNGSTEGPIDIRRDNMAGVIYTRLSPPSRVADALRALLQSYNLRFGAFDLAVTDDGDWVFFELNPNGQWAWLDLVAACDIGASFISAFAE
jgi:hypothetical protein